eukprot:tig00000900_g5351.t1
MLGRRGRRSRDPGPRPRPVAACAAAVMSIGPILCACLLLLVAALGAEARPQRKPAPFGIEELHTSTAHEIDWFSHVPDTRWSVGRHPHGPGGEGREHVHAPPQHRSHGAGNAHANAINGARHHASSHMHAHAHPARLRRHPLEQTYPQLAWLPAHALRKRKAYSQHVSRRLRTGHTVDLHYDHAVPREHVHNLDADDGVEAVRCMPGALHVATGSRAAAERLSRLPHGAFVVGSDAWGCADGQGEPGPVYRQLLDSVQTRGGVTLFTRPAAALDLWEHLDLRFNVTYPVLHDPESYLSKLRRKERSPGRSPSLHRPLLHAERRAEAMKDLAESLRPFLVANRTFTEEDRGELRAAVGGLRKKHGRQLRFFDDIADAFDAVADFIDDLGGQYDILLMIFIFFLHSAHYFLKATNINVEARVLYDLLSGSLSVDIPGLTDTLSKLQSSLASSGKKGLKGFNYDPETRSAVKPIDLLGSETETLHVFCHNCFVLMNPGQVEVIIKATVTIDLEDMSNLLGVSLSQFKVSFKAEAGAGAGITVRLAAREEVDMLVQMQDDLLESIGLDSLASNYMVERTRNETLVEQQEIRSRPPSSSRYIYIFALEEHRQANEDADRPVSAPVNAPAVTRSGWRDGKPVQRTTRVQRTKKRVATRDKKPRKGEVVDGITKRRNPDDDKTTACDPNEIECSVRVLDKWINLAGIPCRLTGYLFIDLDTRYAAGDPYIMKFDPVVFAGLEVGFQYTSDDGWGPITDFYYETHFPNPQFTIPRQRGEISLLLKTGAKLKFFDLVGPRFVIAPRVDLTIDLPTPRCKDPARIPPDELDYSHHFAEVSIDIGLTPAIGVEAELALKTPGVDLGVLTIPEQRFSIANIKHDFDLFTVYFEPRPMWNFCVRVEPDEAPAPTVGITGLELSTGRILVGRPAFLEAIQTAGDKLLSFKWETDSGVDIEGLCGGKLSCQLQFPTAGTYYIKITMFGRNGISESSQTTFNVEADTYWLTILAQVDRQLAMAARSLQPASNATYDIRFFKAPAVHESFVPVLFMPSFTDFSGIPQPTWWWVIADRGGFTRYDERSTQISFDRFGVRSAYLYAYYDSGDFKETYAAPVYRFEIASREPPPPQAILRSPAFWGEFATIDAYMPPSNASAAPVQYQWSFNGAKIARQGGMTFIRRFCAVGQHSVEISAANTVGTTAVTSTITVQSRPPPSVEVTFNWPTLKRKRNPACPEGTLCAVQWVPFLQYTYTVKVTGDLTGVAPISWNISFGDGTTLSVPASERYQADFDEEEFCGPQFETHSGTKDFSTWGQRTVFVSAWNAGGVTTVTRPLNVAFPVQSLWFLAIGSLALEDSDGTFFAVDTGPRYDGVLPPIRWVGWDHNIKDSGASPCNMGDWGYLCRQKLTPSWQGYWDVKTSIGALEVGGDVSLGSREVTRYLKAEADTTLPGAVVVLNTGFWKSKAQRTLATGYMPTWGLYGSAGNTPTFMDGHCNYFQSCSEREWKTEHLERLRLARAGVPGPQYGGIVFYPADWSSGAYYSDQFRFDAEVSMGSDTRGGGGVILSYGPRTSPDGADRKLYVPLVGYLPTGGISAVVFSAQRRVQLYWPGRTLLSTFDIPDTADMRERARLRGDPDPWPTRVRLFVRSNYRVNANAAERCADVFVESVQTVECVVLPNWRPKRDWAFAVSGFTGFDDGNAVDEISLHYVYVKSSLIYDQTAEAIALVPTTNHSSTFFEDFQAPQSTFPPARFTNSVLLGAASPASFPFWNTPGVPVDYGVSLISYANGTFGAWSFYLDWARFFRFSLRWWVNWGGCGTTFSFGEGLSTAADYAFKEPASIYGRVPGRSGLTIQARSGTLVSARARDSGD